ncbi:unnamed protein product [Tilletia controversa]|nr:unnamed protein product [Tilletia controversa]
MHFRLSTAAAFLALLALASTAVAADNTPTPREPKDRRPPGIQPPLRGDPRDPPSPTPSHIPPAPRDF